MESGPLSLPTRRCGASLINQAVAVSNSLVNQVVSREAGHKVRHKQKVAGLHSVKVGIIGLHSSKEGILKRQFKLYAQVVVGCGDPGWV